MSILRVVGDLYIIVIDLQKDVFILGTYVALATIVILQFIKLLYNCLSYLNLEDIYKLIYVIIEIYIYNQYILYVYNDYT